MKRYLVIASSILCFVIVGTLHSSYADPNTIALYCSSGTCKTSNITPANVTNAVSIHKQNKIAVQLSQTCISLEQHHIKSNCLTYKEMQIVDNSNPLLVGQWVNDTWYHRLPAHVHNAYQYYDSPNYLVVVDPDSSFTVTSKDIIVGDSNFTFTNPDQSVGSNHTRSELNGRFVSNCSEVHLAPSVNLLIDTIHYLESGCTSTNYNGTVIKKTNDTAFDLHSEMIKGLSWIHQFKNTTKFTQDCIHFKCKYKDPNSNW